MTGLDLFAAERDLVRSDLDGPCNCCENSTGGGWAKTVFGNETEVEFYVCGRCVERLAEMDGHA